MFRFFFLALDAWGKIPSGIMQGNIFWIGSPYECEHHLRGLNNTVIEQPFRTRTCVIRNDYPSRIEPVYGMCVPQSCNATDIFNHINRSSLHCMKSEVEFLWGIFRCY